MVLTLVYSGECKLILNTQANTFAIGYENFCFTKIQVVLTNLAMS